MDPQGLQPPFNQDTIRKKEQNIIVFHGKHKKWSSHEINTLRSAVRQQNQQIILNKLYERYKSEGSLSEFEREVQRIKDMTDEELESNVDDIDWDLISKSSLPQRSDIDCQIQWKLHCDRSLNNSDWTQEEDQRLKELFNPENPDLKEIANSLGTNRTPLQCYLRYQNKLVSRPSKSKWTPEEDQILTEAVKNYGEKNWQQVAHFLEGRTGQQCLHRWLKTLNPGIRRGKWSEEEDKRLTLAIAAYGSKNWIKVQKHVPGRTDVQCRERWVNILDPNLKNESWTPEEDQRLIEAVRQCEKGKWSKVAALCFPRTDNQCWRRWKSLNRKKLKKENNNQIMDVNNDEIMNM